MAASFITSNKAKMRLPLPKKAAKSTKATNRSEGEAKGKPKSTKRKRTSNPSANKKKGAKKPFSKARLSSKGAKASLEKTETEHEVIDLLDESDDDRPGIIEEEASKSARETSRRKPTKTPLVRTTDSDDDDSEFEFEG
jgi:hypothetical protein